MKKHIGIILALILITPTNINALEIEINDGSQYSYSVSDDENFVDGVMSNSDGYEGTGYEIDGDDVEIINQSRARGSGYDLRWGIENGKKPCMMAME